MTVPRGQSEDYLSHSDFVEVARAFFKQWAKLTFQEINKDLARLPSLNGFDQIYLRAKWKRHIDLVFRVSESVARYDTDRGKLELVGLMFGDELELPASTLPIDIAQRLDWYKERIAAAFTRKIKSDIDLHNVTSPIEQIFLMEWHFFAVEKSHRVKLEPQKELQTAKGTFKIDFVAKRDGSPLSVAIELDGHDYHEKTKHQAARDHKRARAITRQGYTILRFTGSEIFANPRTCVREIVEYIERPEE